MSEEEFKSRYKAAMLNAYASMLHSGLSKHSIVALETFEKIANEKANQAWLEYLKDQK